PQRDDSAAADLRYLYAAADALAPHLHRPCLVVGKSTVPVGTAARLAPRLQSRAPAGAGVELAWKPEIRRVGYADADTLQPARLVIGVVTQAAERPLRRVYQDVICSGTPVVVTDIATAELT